MTSVNESFSYNLNKAAVVQEAKDRARQEGYSFSEYILKLVEGDVEKKREALAERLPILGHEIRQTTISEYAGQAIKTLHETDPDEIHEFIDLNRHNLQIVRQVRQKIHNVLFKDCGLTLTRDEQIGVVKIPRCY